MTINSFSGQYGFLSNTYRCSLIWDGSMCFSVSDAVRLTSAEMTDREFNEKRDIIMYALVHQKFACNPGLRNKLLDTLDARIEAPGSTYWGVVKGVGRNRLGDILMRVREEIR